MLELQNDLFLQHYGKQDLSRTTFGLFGTVAELTDA